MQEGRKHHALSHRQVNQKSHEMTGDMSIQVSQREVTQPLPEPEIGSEGNQNSGIQLTGYPADIELNMGRARARSRTDFSEVGLSKTRTRKVKPPDRFMTVRSGRALLRPRGM